MFRKRDREGASERWSKERVKENVALVLNDLSSELRQTCWYAWYFMANRRVTGSIILL